MPKHCETVLYAEDNWDVPNILKVLGKHDSIKKYVIALHDQDVLADGTPAKPHFHIYLNFGTTNVQLPQVAKWFGVKEQSVEKIKSDKSGHVVLGRRSASAAPCSSSHRLRAWTLDAAAGLYPGSPRLHRPLCRCGHYFRSPKGCIPHRQRLSAYRPD